MRTVIRSRRGRVLKKNGFNPSFSSLSKIKNQHGPFSHSLTKNTGVTTPLSFFIFRKSEKNNLKDSKYNSLNHFSGRIKWSFNRWSERRPERIRDCSSVFDLHRITEPRGRKQGSIPDSVVRGSERYENGNSQEAIHLHVTSKKVHQKTNLVRFNFVWSIRKRLHPKTGLEENFGREMRFSYCV